MMIRTEKNNWANCSTVERLLSASASSEGAENGCHIIRTAKNGVGANVGVSRGTICSDTIDTTANNRDK